MKVLFGLFGQGRVTPGGKALVPARAQAQLPPGFSAERLVAAIRARRDELKARSFLDLIPAQYRDRVRGLAEGAYPSKGEGFTLEEFTERMALSWLANKEAFEVVARESGFEVVSGRGCVPATFGGGILALTVNGSLVALGEPDGAMNRPMLYSRIAEREDTDIAPLSQAFLKFAVACGDRVATTSFSSSEVIAVATKGSVDEEGLLRSHVTLIRTHDEVGRTIWGPRRPK